MRVLLAIVGAIIGLEIQQRGHFGPLAAIYVVVGTAAIGWLLGYLWGERGKKRDAK